MPILSIKAQRKIIFSQSESLFFFIVCFLLYSRFQRDMFGCWVTIQIIQKTPETMVQFLMDLLEEELALRLGYM